MARYSTILREYREGLLRHISKLHRSGFDKKDDFAKVPQTNHMPVGSNPSKVVTSSTFSFCRTESMEICLSDRISAKTNVR
jgi:hypothetical protein